MNGKSLIFFCTAILFSLAGCTATRQPASLPQTGGTQTAAQQTPVGTILSPTAALPSAEVTAKPVQATTPVVTMMPTQSPGTSPAATLPAQAVSPTPVITPSLAARLTNTCDLLSSNDLAKILVTGELEREPVQANPVDHPVFSTENVPATEVTCVYYEFHNPGKKNQELLQVTYWLDLPGQGASATAWQKAWTDAAQAAQPISGIGDQAFLSQNGELSFKQGSLYFTLQVVDTSRTAEQNADITRQLANDMLQNLALMK